MPHRTSWQCTGHIYICLLHNHGVWLLARQTIVIGNKMDGTQPSIGLNRSGKYIITSVQPACGQVCLSLSVCACQRGLCSYTHSVQGKLVQGITPSRRGSIWCQQHRQHSAGESDIQKLSSVGLHLHQALSGLGRRQEQGPNVVT